jgi:hypothetical protein
MTEKCDIEWRTFVAFRGFKTHSVRGSKLRSHQPASNALEVPNPVEGRTRVGIEHIAAANQLYPQHPRPMCEPRRTATGEAYKWRTSYRITKRCPAPPVN